MKTHLTITIYPLLGTYEVSCGSKSLAPHTFNRKNVTCKRCLKNKKSRSTKQVVLIAEMLTDISKGNYSQWVYYSDGTTETNIVPKGPIFVPKGSL